MLGETTPLELRSVNSPNPRTYPTLSALEHDAFNARIWSGLRFRTAMEDGYDIGHRTAARSSPGCMIAVGSRATSRCTVRAGSWRAVRAA